MDRAGLEPATPGFSDKGKPHDSPGKIGGVSEKCTCSCTYYAAGIGETQTADTTLANLIDDAQELERQAQLRAKQTARTPMADPTSELAEVVTAWPTLPEAIKAAILTMIRTTAERVR